MLNLLNLHFFITANDSPIGTTLGHYLGFILYGETRTTACDLAFKRGTTCWNGPEFYSRNWKVEG